MRAAKAQPLGAALLIAAVAACSSSPALAPDGGPGAGGAGPPGPLVFTLPTTNRNVDVLFMLGDWVGMEVNQNRLIAAFPAYVDALAALPGGLPNLHLGVVSSSLGAGRNATIDLCAPGGDQGVFQVTPRGQCTASGLMPGQNFIANINGVANYTGALADVFACIAPLGDKGCFFAHSLASVLRALGADGAPPPPENAGFLRPDALLQIVLLADRDDCSAPPDSGLFDSTSMTPSDPLGPLTSYRCSEFGLLCNGMMPPRSPPGEVDLGMCASNEQGPLLPVGGVEASLRRLKTDPEKIFVAAIAGPPTPYKVGIEPSHISGDPSQWASVQLSCMTSDASAFSEPGVRINQWIGGFGDHGLFESVCADSLAPALKAIAGQLGQALGPACFPANVDPNKCQLVDHVFDADGTIEDVPLRRCADSSDAGPCWDPQTTALCPAGNAVLRRPASSPPSDTTATCAR